MCTGVRLINLFSCLLHIYTTREQVCHYKHTVKHCYTPMHNSVSEPVSVCLFVCLSVCLQPHDECFLISSCRQDVRWIDLYKLRFFCFSLPRLLTAFSTILLPHHIISPPEIIFSADMKKNPWFIFLFRKNVFFPVRLHLGNGWVIFSYINSWLVKFRGWMVTSVLSTHSNALAH